MILQIASLAAVLADQVAQTPFVVQCLQAAPETQWKWWIGALAPWIGPLMSGVVSIYVAWRVFRWQGKKDREQWLLDQKKAEWKELLTQIAEIEDLLPSVLSGVQEYKELEPAVLRIKPLLHSTLFAWPRLKNSEFIARWEEFVSYASFDFMQTVQMDNSATREAFAGEVSWEAKAESARDRTQKEFEIRRRLVALLGDLRAIAHGDLGI